MRAGRRKAWLATTVLAASTVMAADASGVGARAATSVNAAAPAAPAQVSGRPVALVGNFVGSIVTPQEDVFTYVPGAGQDTMRTFANGGVNGGTVTSTIRTYAVSGSYRPVVGDFDDDLRDEIIWYGPGATADSMWDFGESGSVTVTPLSAGGNYQPLTLDMGANGDDDVLWYAPGTAQDHVWDFQVPPAGGAPTHISAPITINGHYRPFVGNLLDENDYVTPEVFWYGPGTSPDVLWQTTPQGVVSTPFDVRGDYRPFTFFYSDLVRDAIWWFAPSGRDHFWYEYNGNWITRNGWDRAEGDYLGQAGRLFPGTTETETIVWTAPDGVLHLWHYGARPGTSEVFRFDYTFRPGATSATPHPPGSGPPPAGP